MLFNEDFCPRITTMSLVKLPYTLPFLQDNFAMLLFVENLANDANNEDEDEDIYVRQAGICPKLLSLGLRHPCVCSKVVDLDA